MRSPIAGPVLAAFTFSLVACAAPAAEPQDSSPSPSAPSSPSEEETGIGLYLGSNGWWENLDERQRGSMDVVAQDLCDAIDDHITYGDIDEASGTQSVQYNAQAIVLELESMRLDMYEHGSGEPKSDDLDDLAMAAVFTHCDKHSRIMEEVFTDHMTDINEFWDEQQSSGG